MPNYNAILILEAIAAAPIPDDVKLQAVKDIRRMYEDTDYAFDCECPCDDSLYEKSNLQIHHLWERSDLGFNFWDKMDQIISQ